MNIYVCTCVCLCMYICMHAHRIKMPRKRSGEMDIKWITMFSLEQEKVLRGIKWNFALIFIGLFTYLLGQNRGNTFSLYYLATLSPTTLLSH